MMPQVPAMLTGDAVLAYNLFQNLAALLPEIESKTCQDTKKRPFLKLRTSCESTLDKVQFAPCLYAQNRRGSCEYGLGAAADVFRFACNSVVANSAFHCDSLSTATAINTATGALKNNILGWKDSIQKTVESSDLLKLRQELALVKQTLKTSKIPIACIYITYCQDPHVGEKGIIEEDTNNPNQNKCVEINLVNNSVNGLIQDISNLKKEIDLKLNSIQTPKKPPNEGLAGDLRAALQKRASQKSADAPQHMKKLTFKTPEDMTKWFLPQLKASRETNKIGGDHAHKDLKSSFNVLKLIPENWALFGRAIDGLFDEVERYGFFAEFYKRFTSLTQKEALGPNGEAPENFETLLKTLLQMDSPRNAYQGVFLALLEGKRPRDATCLNILSVIMNHRDYFPIFDPEQALSTEGLERRASGSPASKSVPEEPALVLGVAPAPTHEMEIQGAVEESRTLAETEFSSNYSSSSTEPESSSEYISSSTEGEPT